MADDPPPPTIIPPRAPAIPTTTPPPAPTMAFTSCTSDDAALKRVPGRRTDDPAYKKRGFRPPSAWYPTGVKPTDGNQVIAYTYGLCTFADMADALSTALSSDHRIYIIGWSTDKGTQLKPGTGGTLEDYLTRSRAQIRAMFYDGNITLTPLIKVKTDVENKWVNDAINNLPNGASVIDAKLPPLGIHHQKLLVVQGQFGLVAFIGGMDIAPSRAAISPPGEPWHDTQIRIAGPAALDCRKAFEDRWLDHPATLVLDQKLGVSATSTRDARRAVAFPQPAALDLEGLQSSTMENRSRRADRRVTVAVGRTFANMKKAGASSEYSFAPSGDYSAWSLIETGIKQAVRWIYLEDQYLVSRMARKALLDKFADPSFEFLLMVMNGSGAAGKDFRYLVTARNEFRRDLQKIDRRRWGLYTLKDSNNSERQKWCGTYLHSKTWIFDDGYVVLGSANCDNRGYTFDTEIVAGIAEKDEISIALGESFATDLRTRLWFKHLGVPHAQLRDFEKGLKFWRQLPTTAMVVDSSGLEPDPDLDPPAPFPAPDAAANVDKLWSKVIDPDAR
ncbi:Phosphatidylserine/phosphatidylglycerophosphate/cardiolipin synthase [Variovorax sp. HW608]|nr:Phosphatidylserine/phosphatidylglycerophosphate/cardiolipin synthase [Variovorax sp. HW608]